MNQVPESSYFSWDGALKTIVIVDTVWLGALTYSHFKMKNEIACLKDEIAKLQESYKQTDRTTSANKTDICAAHKTLKSHDGQILDIKKKLKNQDSGEKINVDDFRRLTRQVEILVNNAKVENLLNEVPSATCKSRTSKRSNKKKHESTSEESSVSSENESSSDSEESFDPLQFNERLNSAGTPKQNGSGKNGRRKPHRK